MKKQKGFSLVELLIVIGIVSILAGVGFANFLGARNRQILETQVDKIVSDLRWTMARSRAQEAGDQWGIHFENPAGGDTGDFYEIWHGGSYASSTVVGRVRLSEGVRFAEPASGSSTDVVFAKATGLPAGNATITAASTQSGDTGTVYINTQGSIDYAIE